MTQYHSIKLFEEKKILKKKSNFLKQFRQLFDIDRSVVTKHLQNVFADGELVESSTCANFAQAADDEKTYQYKFYNLLATISSFSY